MGALQYIQSQQQMTNAFKKLIYNGIYTDDISVASNEVDITEEGYTYLPVTLKIFSTLGNEGYDNLRLW